MSDSQPSSQAAASASTPVKATNLRVPPHSVEAEQAVLGALMLDNGAWDNVVEVIVPQDFYRREHSLIFEAMHAQAERGLPIDVVTLAEVLDNAGNLDSAGGLDYLGELANNTPSTANINAYARIIRERAVLRRLVSVANSIADSAFNPEGRDSATLLDLAEQQVFNINDDRPHDGGPKPLKPLLKDALNKIDQLYNAKGKLTGISTGFKDLDEMTQGLQKSDLIIVAGRPSMGKCIVSGSRLVDPETGERLSIDDMVRRKQGKVHTLDHDFKLRTKAPSTFVDDGLKPTFRVTTNLGREIETTITHPFLTEDGWKPLAEVKPGTRIGVPRQLPVFGKRAMPLHEVKLLAYLIADGGLTTDSPIFTNTNPVLLQEFSACIKAFGGLRVQRTSNDDRAPSLRVSSDPASIAHLRLRFAETLRARMAELKLTAKHLASLLKVAPNTISYWRQGINVPQGQTLTALSGSLALPIEKLLPEGEFSAAKNGKNTLARWLEKQGLWGKAATEKQVPESVFTLPRAQLAVFLNRLFACDGSVFIQNGRQCLLSYSSSSKNLAADVQHLLLRFGILARLRHRQVKYKGERRHAWELVISHQHSIHTFLTEIGIIGKEAAQARALSLLAQKQEHSNTDSLPESACDYLLALKGQQSWKSIYERKGLTLSHGYNPHLSKGRSRRLLSRSRAEFFATLLDDDYLLQLANSDLYWDTVASIEPTGIKQVYDLTVPDTHNFVAEDILVHNTSYAMNLVEHAILNYNKPVLVFSLEMPADSLIMRMLSSLGRIDQSRMRSGQLEEEDWPKLTAAMNKLKDRPLFIDDTPGLSPMEMRSRARRVAREHGELGMIMVDYLQLMQVKGSSENRTGEISEISRSLKTMAREFNCPLIALSQLNRSLEQRPNKRPVMSDLRESGAIEQDADVIMFVYRDEVYNEDSEYKGMAEIIIGKQRNGPIGTRNLSFIGKYTRFENFMPMSGAPDFDHFGQ